MITVPTRRQNSSCWLRNPVLQVLLSGLLAFPKLCLADGGVIPALSVEKPPAMPSQTALIVHENGTETLIVESAFKPEAGDRFAWVVPVPAEPTSIQATTPGLLRNLQVCFGPRILGSSDLNSVIWTTFLLIAVILITAAVVNPTPTTRRQVSEALILLGITAVMALMAVPDLSGAAGVVSAEATLSRTYVGNYEVNVVRVSSAEELDNWLEQNNFAQLSLAGRAAVEAYVSQQWVFVISRLLTNGQHGLKTPHPLKIVFPSKNPVYPMRLTAISGSECQVDLFCATGGAVTSPGMRTIFSDQLTSSSIWQQEDQPALRGRHSEAASAHPRLLELVRPDMWLTHLRGTFTPQQMMQDLQLNVSQRSSPDRLTLYAPRAAAKKGLIVALLMLCIAVPVAAWTYRSGVAPVGWVMVPLFLLPLLVGSYIYYSLEKAEVSTIGMYRVKRSRMQSDIRQMVIKSRETSSTSELLAGLPIELRQVQNLYTGEPMKVGDEPGDYEITTTPSGEKVLRVYLVDGSRTSLPLLNAER